MHIHWVQQLVRFWNRMLELQGSDRLVACAFQDNLDLMREQTRMEAKGGAVGSPCWCLRWFRSLQSAPTDTGTLVWLTKLDEGAILKRAMAAYVQVAAGADGTLNGNSTSQPALGSALGLGGGIQSGGPAVSSNTPPPGQANLGCVGSPGTGGPEGPGGRLSPAGVGRTAADAPRSTQPCPGNKFAFYLECVRGELPLGQLAPHLKIVTVRDARHRASLSRLRCSSHDLRVERDRYLPSAVKPPRHLRTCLLCASDATEDEHHMIFECPLYDSLRFRFSEIFSTDCSTLDCFLNQTNQDRVAKFVHACFGIRRQVTQMGLAGPDNAFSL